MKKICGIYRIFWNNNPYYYYGQAQNFYFRRANHLSSLVNSRHENIKLQNVFNKYGVPSIEIIELCSLDKLNEIEQKYIDLYFGDKFCCNISPNSESNKGLKFSDETKIYIGKKTKEALANPEIRKKISERTKLALSNPETKKKISMVWKGRKQSPEHIKKRANARRGKKQKCFSLETIEKMKIARLGKKLSHETKEKISCARIGMIFSESHKKNLSISHLNNKCRGKIMINILNGLYYESIKEAYNSINTNICLRDFYHFFDGKRKNTTQFILV